MSKLHNLKSILDPMHMFDSYADNDQFQDTTLVCRDQTISSSKLLLALAFPTLENILLVREECLDLVIFLPDFTAENVRNMLNNFLFGDNTVDQQQDMDVKNETIDELKEEVCYEDFEKVRPYRMYKCQKCNEGFISRKQRGIHMASCPEPFKCFFCDETFSDEGEFQAHEQLYKDGERFKCRINTCSSSSTFRDKFQLVRHLKACHSQSVKSFKCYFCENIFSTRSEFQAHRDLYKVGNEYKCSYEDCEKVYKAKIALRDHMRRHRGDFRYECEPCGKLFATPEFLNAHNRTHGRTERLFVCDICSKDYKDQGSLNAHLKASHFEKDKYPCEVCGKCFPEKHRLKRHFIASHSGIRAFSCSHCGKSFGTKNICEKHEMIHTGVKNYHCSVCGKGFVSSNKVKRHEVLHTGLKQFKCQKCGKEFNQKGNCHTHEKKCSVNCKFE